MDSLSIRTATLNDAPALLEIYAPFVRDTVITFEYEVPSLTTFQSRIEKCLSTHTWLLACLNEKIVGYAYAGTFRERVAYARTCESSIYLSPSVQGLKIKDKTLATHLYERLFETLREKKFEQVIGVITSPNPQSERFHEKLGFQKIGVFPAIGFKFDKHHDVVFMQKPL